MIKLQRYFVSIIIIAGISFNSGCASSSNSLRYKSSGETISERYENSVRFTSVDTVQTSPVDIEDADSLEWDYLVDDSDSDEFPDEETAVSFSEVVRKINPSDNSSQISADYSNMQEKVLMEIIEYLNTPYKYGGNSKKGIDCSAFTQTIFNNTLSIQLLRSAREQYTQGTKIDNREELKFGDLVFFNTRRRVKPGHVGIYIGDNLFAHASSKKGVIVSSLDLDYYSKRFMGGRRMENNGSF
ncbi:MAG: C40 family peptidase [Ignavibacteriales bacterium]|nr:MAG: C40 family peptidase [Ignavibacteriales bacterium]